MAELLRAPQPVRAWEHKASLSALRQSQPGGTPLGEVLRALLNPFQEEDSPAQFCSPMHDMVRQSFVELAQEKLSLSEARGFLKVCWEQLAAASARLRTLESQEAEEAVRRALGALQQLHLYFQDPDLARLATATRLWSQGLLDLERLWTEELAGSPTSVRAVNLAVRGFYGESGFQDWARGLRGGLLLELAGRLRAPLAEWELATDVVQALQQLLAPQIGLDTLGQYLETLLSGVAGAPFGDRLDEDALTPLFLRLARQGDSTPPINAEFRTVLERGQWVADQMLLDDEESEPLVDFSESLDQAVALFADWRRAGGATARRVLDEFEQCLRGNLGVAI